jgi:hypothetical protein
MNTWKLEHSKEVLINTHSPDQCLDEVCVLHNMTDHSMRSFPQHWRDDRAIMERICTHGVGHPDPDQIPFWQRTRSGNWEYEMIHGCDGCCC